MSNVSENLQNVQQDVIDKNVRIIAVSKYVTNEKIIEAFEAGIRDFAESKVQDAEVKRNLLPENINESINWHFIGHLQTNKVKKVIGKYDFIHSLDSLKLAKVLDEEAGFRDIKQKVLIQVNVAKEEQKYGFGVEEVKEVFTEIINFNSLKVAGFMCMAPFTEDEQILHSAFRELRELRDYLQEVNKYELPELSMGMSNDYKIAVDEGSTMIRIGSALFK